VLGGGLRGGAVLRIEVDGKGAAGEVLLFGWEFDALEAVPGDFRRLKDHGTIANRQRALDGVCLQVPWIGVELDESAPVVFPLIVQEVNQVEAAVPEGLRVVVEVDVRIEILSGEVLVGSSADVVGIVEQVGGRGVVAEPGEEVGRADAGVEVAVGGADGVDVWASELAADSAVIASRGIFPGGGELVRKALAESLDKEVIEDDVWERLRGGEALAQAVALFDELVVEIV
jgi:hypothetical protein